ncbi:MAG: Uma2 family endonuclease [Verrucomicrobiota bacterium]
MFTMSTLANATDSDRIYTLDEFMQLDFDQPVELVDGRIKLMGWNNLIHASLVSWLSQVFRNWNDSEKWGFVFSGDAGIRTRSNPDTARGADLICISHERYAQVETRGKVMDTGPELIVEVVSPSNSWIDINEKLMEYFEVGTSEVWVISPANGLVSVYSSIKEISSYQANEDDSVASRVLPNFELSLKQMTDEIAKVS